LGEGKKNTHPQQPQPKEQEQQPPPKSKRQPPALQRNCTQSTPFDLACREDVAQQLAQVCALEPPFAPVVVVEARGSPCALRRVWLA
jgi:hypothetical protein